MPLLTVQQSVVFYHLVSELANLPFQSKMQVQILKGVQKIVETAQCDYPSSLNMIDSVPDTVPAV